MEEENEIIGSNTLNLIDDSKPKYKGILGTLKGIFADMKNPTRNGRLYSRECWQHALENEDVKEKLETRTMFGELDHPNDRLETLQERAAIVVTKLEMDDKNQVIMGEADILDTPFGRILKTFIDAGVKVGISSRGSGEEVTSLKTEGNEIVPETFYLETFDVVALPAVKKARLSLVESKHNNLIMEAFKKEIKDAKTQLQKDELTNYAKENGVLIQESLTTSLGGEDITPEQESEDNIDVSSEVISKLEEELSVSNTKVKELDSLCNMMKSHAINVVKELKETRIVNEQLSKKLEDCANEKDQFLDDLAGYQTSNKYLKSILESKTSNLNEALSNKDKEIATLNNKISSLNEELENTKKMATIMKEGRDKLKSNLKESLDSNSNNKRVISKLEEDFNSVKEEKANLLLNQSKLEEKLNEANQTNIKASNLLELKEAEIKSLNEEVQKLTNKLTESTKQNSNLKVELKQVKEAYINDRAKDNLIDASKIKKSLKENYNVKEADKEINEAIELKNSIDNLSFNLGGSLLSESKFRTPEDNENSSGSNSTLKQMAKIVSKK